MHSLRVMKSSHLFLILTLLLNFSCGDKKDSSNPPVPEVSTPESSPQSETKDPLKVVKLASPSGEMIEASIAYTSQDQQKGLQNVKEEDFGDNEGKLFFYLKTSPRTFWMPNTYFNLDIFYLDENLKIIDIVWNLEHYTGDVNSEIPRAPTIASRHVLEMKNGSPISSKLRIGDHLGWNSPLSLLQTELKIRQQL